MSTWEHIWGFSAYAVSTKISYALAHMLFVIILLMTNQMIHCMEYLPILVQMYEMYQQQYIHKEIE